MAPFASEKDREYPCGVGAASASPLYTGFAKKAVSVSGVVFGPYPSGWTEQASRFLFLVVMGALVEASLAADLAAAAALYVGGWLTAVAAGPRTVMGLAAWFMSVSVQYLV